MLSGCAHTDLNKAILKTNQQREVAFQKAMVAAAATKSVGDDIAIAMAFSAGLGQQQLVRPETVLDYMNGLFPYFSLGVNAWWMGNGQKTNMSAGRDIYVESSRSSSGFDMTNSNGTQSFSVLPSEE